MDRYQIAAATGFNDGYLGMISPGMRARGWIGMHGRGGGRTQFGGQNRWWITERGRIVLAVECGRRTKARAKGIKVGYEGSEGVRRYRYAWSAAERALGL